MRQQLYPDVLAHWHQPFDDFRTSSQEFYDAVADSLNRRQIPGLRYERILWREVGWASAEREYLRVRRRDIVFDICAAPFGTGYFFSWWLAIGPPSIIDWFIVGALSVFFVSNIVARWDSLLSPIVAILLLFPFLWIVAAVGHARRAGLEGAVMQIPVVGTIYRAAFRPTTYYQIDTALMFRAEVEASVKEVINGLRASKGLRVMSAEEEKPVLSELLRRE